jgi:hypothetical protein
MPYFCPASIRCVYTCKANWKETTMHVISSGSMIEDSLVHFFMLSYQLLRLCTVCWDVKIIVNGESGRNSEGIGSKHSYFVSKYEGLAIWVRKEATETFDFGGPYSTDQSKLQLHSIHSPLPLYITEVLHIFSYVTVCLSLVWNLSVLSLMDNNSVLVF